MSKHTTLFVTGTAAVAYLAAMVILAVSHSVDSRARFAQGHDNAECSTCHSFVAQAETDYSGYLVGTSACRKCHVIPAAEQSGPALSFHYDKDRNCLDCHSYHDREVIRAGQAAFRFAYNNPSLLYQCASCHSHAGNVSRISPGHRAAAAVYHSDFKYLGKLSPSESCLICHSKGSFTVDNATIDLNPPRFNEHASHPVSVRVVPGRGTSSNRIRTELDPRLSLFNGKIECQTCHSLTSENTDLVVMFREDFDVCVACHEHLTD